MKKNKKLVILFFIFCLLLSITTLISFSSNTTTQEVLIKSITPIYDETSTIKVDNNNVVFNDKNQVVKYNVVLENTQDYDVKISDIKLSTPTEEFLSYKVEDIKKDDVLSANSTKELTVSFETMGIKGWGRNFADELTANISFEKVVKQEVTPPTEEENKQEEIPKAPATNIEEIVKEAEKIEVISIINNIIEFTDDIKLEEGQKIAVWIYSEPIFLGYFEVVENDGVKQIVGLEDSLKQIEIKLGKHNIVLATEDRKILGYAEVYVSENNTLSQNKIENATNEDESSKEENKVENPNTSDKKLVGILGIATCITGVAIIIVSKNKLTKYTVFILMLSSAFTITNAEDVIKVAIKNNICFNSQNVMKMAYTVNDNNERIYQDYWRYREQLKNFYIMNEIVEIKEYDYKFDVTEEQNGKVIAYLVTNSEDSNYYDIYLMADGIIYPNSNASLYFGEMKYLDKIDHLAGIDTSEVTNMMGMFFATGFYSEVFELDVSAFNTSKVINMEGVFNSTGYNSKIFELDVSNFDTSKVTNMKKMFSHTGYTNPNFTLDVSNFDTSNVTDMNFMFNNTGFNSKILELDVSNFDTSNVTNMATMFQRAGYSNQNFTLDVSNFDTSNVTNMRYMFYMTGYNSENLILDVSDFNTAKVTDMKSMFYKSGYSNINFTLDVSKFDTSKVTEMSYMFCGTGYNSNKLNTSITIANPNITSYSSMFYNVAAQGATKLKVNYTTETEELVDKMIATKSANSNVVKGNLIVDINNLSTGDEIHISGEKFNVISQTDDTITMLAKYNLDSNYRQSKTENRISFSDGAGWQNTPGPKEIDIQQWSTNPKTYVNAYIEYLKIELGDNSVTGNLITLNELKNLGCTIAENYSSADGLTCAKSVYESWLVNDQAWWTCSSHSVYSSHVWLVNTDGRFNISYSSFGVRPTITISKSALKEYLKA